MGRVRRSRGDIGRPRLPASLRPPTLEAMAAPILSLLLTAVQAPSAAPAQEVLRADPTPRAVGGAWRALGPLAQAGAPSAASALPPEREISSLRAGQPWTPRQHFTAADGGLLAWQDVELEVVVAQAAAELIHPPLPYGLGTGVVEPRRLLPRAAALESGPALAAYFHRTVLAREATREDCLLVAEGGARVWCNGELVADADPGAAPPAQPLKFTLPLEAGLNHLVIKSATAGGAWSFELQQAEPLSQPRIDRAIQDGTRYLLERQLVDGSWQEHPEYGVGASALATYALLKSGVPPTHAAVQRALALLRARPAAHTYSMALALLALVAAGDPADDERILEWADELAAWQEPTGMWGYPSGGDLSNTQYAALGLWAAAKRGHAAPDETWRDLTEAVLACQAERNGRGRARTGANAAQARGFAYVMNSDGATPSMTAAGIGTLAICLEHLPDGELARRAREAIAAGSAWLGENCVPHGIGGDAGSWINYTLYGLERAGALTRQEKFGAHPWYPEGAEWLLARQRANGGWAPADSNVSTSFALLFLARATAKAAVTREGGGSAEKRLLASDPAEGPLRLRVALGDEAHLWIDATTPDFARIARVVYWVRPPGGEWQRLEGGRTKRFDARQALDAPGQWLVRASAFLHDGATFGSGTLEIGQAEAGRMVGADAGVREAERGAANLLPTGSPQARASSGAADFAVDRSYATRWHCAESDAAPWLEVELERRVQVNRIALCPAAWEPSDPALRVAPERVTVRVNGGAPRHLELPPPVIGRVVLDLGETVLLRTLRVEILSLRNGALGAAAAGFGEIEAFLER